MIISEKELKRFAKLDRAQVLALRPLMKQKFFYALQVRHKKLETVAEDLKFLLGPFNETKILSLIGATGAGKTTLAERLLASIIRQLQQEKKLNRSKLPFLYVSAPATGDKGISWAGLYEGILNKGGELLVNKKQANLIEDGIIKVIPRRYKNLTVLQNSIIEMMKNRGVLLIPTLFGLTFSDCLAPFARSSSYSDSW